MKSRNPPTAPAEGEAIQRLMALAVWGATDQHRMALMTMNMHEKHEKHEDDGTLTLGFDTCPHPDCVLVRAPLAGPVDASGEPELQIAERIARGAHAGQKDTVTGADYITHVERVVALVDGDDAKAVAWLHDVLEDCDEWTYDDLMREGISQRVCDAVDALTRRPPYGYAEYIEQIRVDKNSLVIAVKLADLRDHLQPNCPARLRPRYEAALKALTAAAAVPSSPAQPTTGNLSTMGIGPWALPSSPVADSPTWDREAFELQLEEDAERLVADLSEGEGEHTEALDMALVKAAFRHLLTWASPTKDEQ